MTVAKTESIPGAPASSRPCGTVNWNLQELSDRLDGDEELLHELLVLFQTDSHTELLKAKGNFAEEDWGALSRTAHTIRGMLRNLSMDMAAGLAFELEVSAQAALKAESQALLERLDRAVAENLKLVDVRLAR